MIATPGEQLQKVSAIRSSQRSPGAGGGRGLRVASSLDQLHCAIQSALNEAGGSGADQELFLEHYLDGARHVEVQVAGDGRRSIVIGDRDCSLQRRHQKVVEEAPAPGLSDELRTGDSLGGQTMAEGISAAQSGDGRVSRWRRWTLLFHGDQPAPSG